MSFPIDPEAFGLFLAVMGVLAITPGPANVFAIATGLSNGGRDALIGVLGMNCATLVWFLAAALGLGALVAAYPAAFRVLAVLGAAYVGWLGLKALWAAWKGAGEHIDLAAKTVSSPFAAGFAVQLANPKAVLFFTAVLPPFLDPSRAMAPQLAGFATATIGMDVLAMSAYGLAGGALAARFRDRWFRRGFSAFVGALLLLAAILIALRL
jgi:threonine/homoserine/homoserine lactone efflux protein